MKPEKKIFLDRKDDLEKAKECLEKSLVGKVVLNIPKDSVLGAKINNFEILKKESIAKDKELVIESVDEHILEIASLAGLESINPFFKSRGRVFADILPKIAFAKKVKEEKITEPQQEFKKVKEPEVKIVDFRDKIKKNKERKSEPANVSNLRRITFVLVVVVFIFSLAELALNILPKANISVTFKKNSLDFDEKIEVSSAATEPVIEVNGISLPGELLVAQKNLEMNFESSNQEKVELKAKGKLTVYNTYSASPQILVASTRFESPDKKIFRLDKQVTVPGAQIVNGKIVPSKIEAAVTADQAGEAYNLAPSFMWRIPGFSGSPRYDGFYAEAKESFTGGFIGERSVPTAAEIEKAKVTIGESLRNILKSQLLISLQGDFKIIEGATISKITKEEVQNSNQAGSFSIFAEGEIRQLIFKEAMLKEVLIQKARQSLVTQKMKVYKFDLNYGSPEVNLDDGKMILPVKGTVVFESDIDEKILAERIRGRGQEELKALIFALPGLEKANISLWPFWVRKVPENGKRVNLSFD